jgi:hypothetical protein
LVDSGAPPYVDFSLFGPHGRRLLKKLTYIESCFNPSTGDWTKRELPGPADVAGWARSFAVLECTLLLLSFVKAERLRNYLDRISHFCSLYGPHCWPIIYQADCRMRCEHFERLRRQLESQHSHYAKTGAAAPPGFIFDPAAPWDAVFGAAARDEAFWTSEVKDKCILFLARLAPSHALLSAGTTIDPPASYSGSGSHSGGGQSNPGQRPRGSRGSNNRKGHGKGSHAQAGGNKGTKGAGKAAGKRKGADNNIDATCLNYNAGKCKSPCTFGRRHICSKCGGAHPVSECKS